MSRLSRLSFGLLAAGVAIAAPFSGHAGTNAAAAPRAIGWGALSTGSGMPTDTVPANFRFRLLNPHPCVRDTVVLVVAGFASTPCDSLIEAFARDQTHVVYHTQVRDSIGCILRMPLEYLIRIPLGLFAAGPQRIEIEWVIDHVNPGKVGLREVHHIPIDFVVTAECGPTEGLPYVDHVQIGPPDGGTPPCVPPGDSIPVFIAGHFPNGCFTLAKVEVLPDDSMGPMPRSPGVRLTVEDCACCTIVCADQPVRWSASIKLPPLPAFAYKLPVELVRTSCNSTIARFAAGYPYVVSDSCARRIGCILPSFDPGGAPHECDAQIGPGQPARLTLFLRSTTALSGLQGELALSDPTLHVTQLAAAGPAQGMRLRWTPTPRGARFALISDQGAPILPVPPNGPAPPVLEIEVEQGATAPTPVTLLDLVQLLAADGAGQEVPWCPTLAAGPSFRYAAYARICSGPRPVAHCDFNGDGREDIRDLVLMVRCLRDSALCGDSTAHFDCNQDGTFTLDDVLCCAGSILGQDCVACPPGETRDARDLKLGLGPPVGRLPSPGLPIRIEGGSTIGGARLTLRFPEDRYDVSGVDLAGAAPTWIHVTHVSGGRVVIGLIKAAEAVAPETDIAFTLQLALKPGREPGGEVALESAELAAPDGVRLAANVPALRQPLGGAPRIALSENRPNPFAGSTRFAVTLDRPGLVEVGIYDLGGRRLVTLHRGELPAGTREFSWDGRLGDGARARDGVYFYRAAAGTETLARKLVLLQSP